MRRAEGRTLLLIVEVRMDTSKLAKILVVVFACYTSKQNCRISIQHIMLYPEQCLLYFVFLYNCLTKTWVLHHNVHRLFANFQNSQLIEKKILNYVQSIVKHIKMCVCVILDARGLPRLILHIDLLPLYFVGNFWYIPFFICSSQVELILYGK